MKRKFLTMLLLAPAIVAAQTSEPGLEMLPNGEMEGPFVNGLARGWVANCYGSNEVVFAQESTDAGCGWPS